MPGSHSSAFHKDQFEAIYPEGVERHFWNLCRNDVILDGIRSIGDPGPILEVGCGKGLVVSYLRGKGCNVTGVELAAVKPLGGMEYHIRTSMDALDLPTAERDRVKTILLLDIIEHLQEPSEFVNRLREGFPALEHMVITVPARQELFSNFDEFNGHCRRYDMDMLRTHLAMAGGTPVHLHYFFHTLYPIAWLQLQWSKKRRLFFSVPPKGPSSWMHALMGRLFVAEYKIVPGSWPGSSIIGIFSFNGI